VPKLAPSIIGISGIELSTVPRAILGRQAPLVHEAPINTAPNATPILPEVQRSLQSENVRVIKTKARALARTMPPMIPMNPPIEIAPLVSITPQASLTPSSPIKGTKTGKIIVRETPLRLPMHATIGKTHRDD